jgi:hypothetical protein
LATILSKQAFRLHFPVHCQDTFQLFQLLTLSKYDLCGFIILALVVLSIQNFNGLKVERNSLFLLQGFILFESDTIRIIYLQSSNILVLLSVVDGLDVVDMHVILPLNIIVHFLLTLSFLSLYQFFNLLRIRD